MSLRKETSQEIVKETSNKIITTISFILETIAKENIDSRMRTKHGPLTQNKTRTNKVMDVSIGQRNTIETLMKINT